MKFYKDFQWYFALLLGVIVWLGYGTFVNGFQVAQRVDLWRAVLFGVLIYPVLEEIVFRGWIQGQLIRRGGKFVSNLNGITLANFLTSILFSVLHLIYQNFLWAALIFFPSLVFGYFRDRFNRLSPSIIIHAFYNLGFILLFK